MPVNRYATQAGKKYQRDLMKYLREQGLDAENLRETGVEDEGDVALRILNTMFPGERRFVLEAKREKGFKLGPWLGEAVTERDHYDRHRGLETPSGFVVVHARRNYPIGRSFVTTELDEWLRQIR